MSGFVTNWIDRLTGCESLPKLERLYVVACDRCSIQGIMLYCESCPIEEAYRVHKEQLHFMQVIQKDMDQGLLKSSTVEPRFKPVGANVCWFKPKKAGHRRGK